MKYLILVFDQLSFDAMHIKNQPVQTTCMYQRMARCEYCIRTQINPSQ